MNLKDWLKREKIAPLTFANAIGISRAYAYNVINGHVFLGVELCREVIRYTEGEVTLDDLRPIVKAKCPTCGYFHRKNW